MDGPRLFKRSRWWAADLRAWGGNRPTLRDPAKAKGERTEFRDVARGWAEVYVARLRHDAHDRQRGIKKTRALKEVVDEYLDHRRSMKAYGTWKNDVTATGHLLETFGAARAVHTISTEDIQAWVDARAATYAPGSLMLHAINMRSFFKWAGHPIGKVTTPVGHRNDPDALSDEEIEAVQDACETDVERMLVGVGLATGGRKAELWALDWSDFKADGRSVRFQRQMGWPGTSTKGLKGKRNRTALVLPDYIKETGSGRVLEQTTEQTASNLFRRLLERAGAWRIGRGTHVMRHTYGRLGMERYGWSTEMLRIFMGHQSVLTTQGYAHFGELAAIKMASERTYGS